MKKITVREYGFFMPTFAMFVMGAACLVTNELCGSEYAASAGFIAAGILILIQRVIEEIGLEDSYDAPTGHYTADKVVDYMIITLSFTAVASIGVGIWMVSPTMFITLPAEACFLGSGYAAYTWVASRYGYTKPNPVDNDFDLLVWVLPFATAALLVLNYYGRRDWAGGIFCTLFIFHFGWVSVLMYSGTKSAKKADPLAHKDDPFKVILARRRQTRSVQH